MPIGVWLHHERTVTDKVLGTKEKNTIKVVATFKPPLLKGAVLFAVFIFVLNVIVNQNTVKMNFHVSYIDWMPVIYDIVNVQLRW